MTATTAQFVDAPPLRGATIIEAVKAAGVDFVVSVPDIVTCEGVLWPMTDDPDFRIVPVCKEDEGVSICAALSYCERRAILLIQHTGLLDSINAVRAIAAEYALPVCMMVGLQGMEPDRVPRDSNHYGIRILEPILDVMELDCRVIASDEDAAGIAPAIERAYADSRPLVFLVSRSPV